MQIPKEIDNLCFKIWDGISNIFENMFKELAENLSKNEFQRLQNIMDIKNESQIINIWTKTSGLAVTADREDVIIECKRQLYDFNTYNKRSLEEMEI